MSTIEQGNSASQRPTS